MRTCTGCDVVLTQRHKIKYCSNKCQQDYLHRAFIDKWKMGLVSGMIGIGVRVTSEHIRRYLIDSVGEKCSQCGWHERHSLTGRVPLDVDHIDGNSENNREDNLRLLCPNCHSLTPFYKNLNRGKGRKWRMSKYIKEAPKEHK